MFRLLIAATAALATAALTLPAAAQDHGTPARAAIVIDLSSDAVLLEKNADEALPPASMSKLMTLYMVFEALERGVISMDDMFRTSKRASSMAGSKMFLREGEQASVADLLRGVIVQSGNDAAVALAEALAGTEEAFAERMNQVAAEIGLTNSHFANATGWPDDSHRMSTRDLATLSARIIEDHPDLYPMFAEQEFEWDGVNQRNRNPLLDLDIGADGLKTGHTEEAGYGLAASAIRDGRRVVVVIAGLDGAGDRKQEAERLINWAFRAFETRRLYAAGQGLVEAPVWIGATSSVMLAPARDVTVTAPYGALDDADLRIRFDGPVPAPISAGQLVGHIELEVPGLPLTRVPLVASHDVARGGFVARVQAAAELLLRNLVPG